MNYPIDSKHLAVFVKLSQNLNMRKTSEELHLTPSAISHTLKCLEDDLGARLFDRSSRKMSLTDAGHNFLPDALRILEIMDGARQKVTANDAWATKQLRIGASPTACQFILPAVIREFKESFPDVAIKIETAISREAEVLVREGKIDLAISIKIPMSSSIEFSETSPDRICFIVNPLHKWAKDRTYDLSDLTNERIIFSSSRTYTNDLLNEYFRPKNIMIKPFIEIGNEEIIKQFVRLNLGVGIIPPWIAAQEIEDGLLIPVELGETNLNRRWGVMYSNYKSLTFPEHMFIGITSHVCKNLMGSFN